MFMTAQKTGPDALNATQKTQAFYEVRFLKKSRKLPKFTSFWPFWLKMGIFMRFFLDFFRNHTLKRAWVFCVAFSATGRFF